jgi:hypothetical protein
MATRMATSLARSAAWPPRRRSRREAELLLQLLSGADAPNVSIPMLRPSRPTYRAHPSVDAFSTETRARDRFRQHLLAVLSCSLQYCSNSSHDGMLTTRALIPSCCSCS